MPTPRVPMSKQRQILQLLHDGHLSTRKIAAALNISKTSVGDIAKAARLAGLDWDVQAASEDAKDQEVAEFCREVVDTLNMRECLLHLLDAIKEVGFKYSTLAGLSFGVTDLRDRLASVQKAEQQTGASH